MNDIIISAADYTPQQSELAEALEQLTIQHEASGKTGDLPKTLPCALIKAIPEVFYTRGKNWSEYQVGVMCKALQAGFDLEPILVIQIADATIVVDGHHRLEAYGRVKGAPPVPVRYFPGTPPEALLEAVRRNAQASIQMDGPQRQTCAWRLVLIADEAHSSQTGATAAQLRAVLSPEELESLGDGGEVSAEDIMAAQMQARAAETGVTYVAFTATPKGKTLELFGRRPDPTQPASAKNLPAAFHVYSMRQAIEEGFILDVLQNYTPFGLAFKLANNGVELDDTEVERSEAVKTLMRWVRLHPYNIAQKVQIVVEHYRANVQPLLDGRAKAMVVVGSRVEAVRWQLAVQKYIAEKGYKLGTLVAFSGEVTDPDSGEEPFTEASKALNPDLKGRDIREAFKLADYHLLLVANKFQTGFDQPLLCGMYVDKRLAGIQAVQTLSRLNRAHPGKDTTFVLDFVNSGEDILAAFKTYHETAELENVTDPHLVFNLRAKLDALGYYHDHEVNRVVIAELNPNAKQSDLVAAIMPVADRLLRSYREAQKRHADAIAREDKKAAKDAQDELNALLLFRNDMGAYVRLYTFLSQIFDYGNTDIEARSIFFRRLIPLLEFGRQRETVDTSKIVLTHHKLSSMGKTPLVLGGMGEKLQAIYEAGSGSVQEKEKALLAEIIAKVNDLFQGEVSDDDQLIYVNNVLKGKLLQSDTLVQQAANNTKEQFSSSPDLHRAIVDAVIDAMDAHQLMSQQALGSKRVQDGLRDVLLGPGQLYEELRGKTGRPAPDEPELTP